MTAPRRSPQRVESWLRRHHASWQTDRRLLDAAAQRAGFDPVTYQRVIVGQANEVYAVATTGGDLIVRVSHRPDPRFEAEAAVIDRVRAIGVPVAEVVAIENLPGDSGATALMIQRRAPGVMLGDYLTTHSSPASVLEAVGEVLGRVHSVEVDGFGLLDRDLNGTHSHYGDWFVDLFIDGHLPAIRAATADDARAESLVAAAIDHMVDARALLDSCEARLAHGDFSPTNILVHNDAVSAFVDWEAAKGAPTANDFAWWTTTSAMPHRAAAIRAGYQRHASIGEAFEDVHRLSEIRILLTLLAHTKQVGNKAGYHRSATRLAELLRI